MSTPEERSPIQSGASDRKHSPAGYLSVLLASALFASAFTLAKIPLASIDPLALSAIVYVIAGIALIPFGKASFRVDLKKDYFYLFLITVLGAVLAPVLLLYGLQQTTASDGAILANGEVIFTIILSSIIFGEKPKGALAVFAIGLVIVGLFIATTDMDFSKATLSLNAGNIMILAAMFLWAVDNNFSRRLTMSPGASPAKIAMIKCLAGGAILLAAALALGRGDDIAAIDANNWMIIVVMSVSGFGAALLFFLHGIKMIGTIKTMSVFSTVPIFGIIIAAVVLGESISIFQGIATGLVIAGILMLSRR